MQQRFQIGTRIALLALAAWWASSSGTVRAGTLESQLPCVTRQQVEQLVSTHKAEWLSHVKPGQSRVYVTQEEWPQLITRLQHAQGKEAQWIQLLFDSAERVASQPIPVYHPPEYFVNQGRPLVWASQEGWIRGLASSAICLSLADKIKSKDEYKKRIHDLVMALCSYPTWGRYGKNDAQSNMDLIAGAVISGISTAYDWNRDLFSDAEKETIRQTMRARVNRMLDGLYGEIFWSNWYSQNHNHICAGSLGIAGATFLDEIPEAANWLAGGILNFQYAVDAIDPDGSSYEGAGYWSYGRMAIFTFIEGTRKVAGTENLYQAPALRYAAEFRIGSSIPGLNGVLLWSDCRGHDVCGSQYMLYKLASEFHDPEAQYLADHLPYAPKGGADSAVWTVLWYDPTIESKTPSALDYHAKVWDVITSRSGWGDGDYMLSIKSGLNSNHHTHLDAGSLSLNVGGNWLLFAPGYSNGVGNHSYPGFFDNKSGKRWEYFSNATQSHSTLLINGANQRYDAKAIAKIDHEISADDTLWAEVDLSTIYTDAQNVRRRIFHRRGDYILVLDSVQAAKPVQVEWLAQLPPDAQVTGDTILAVTGVEDLRIRSLDHTSFVERKPTSPVVEVSQTRLKTYATRHNGDQLHLATLLQPRMAGMPDVNLQTSWQTMDDMNHATVSDSNWQDEIWVRKQIGEMKGDATYHAVAESMTIRRIGNQIISMTVCNGTQATIGSLELASARHFDAAWHATPGNAAVLVVGSEFNGRIAHSGATTLFNQSGKPVVIQSDGTAVLSAGRYLLAADADAAAKAWRWAASQHAPRSKPSRYQPGLASLPPAPATAKVSWEAENDPEQSGGGAAEIQSAPNASGGKALVSFGAECAFQKIAWKINVPADGSYYLKMRYSADQPTIEFALLLDGVIRIKEAEHARIPGPKGWGADRYWIVNNFDWIESLVSDGTGEPIRIPLTKGQHEIRLESPTGGLNLDCFELVAAREK